MKNLFTYKNSIASSLKRYSKFLLLAVMFLAFNTQAWAAAPAGLYMKCNTTTDVEDYSSTDYKWENMHKVAAGKWEITVTLENQKNNFFVGTNKTASGLFTKNVSFEAKDNSSCVTTVDKDKDYGGKRRIYIGKDDNASCEVTFIITYISDTQYKLEIVDVNPVVPCEDKEPTVTTGTMTVDAYNFFVVNDNNLIDLGTNCDVAIAYQSKGVEITTNKEGSKDRYTTVTSGATGNTLGVYTITATGVQPQNNTTYWYRAYAINNTSAGIGNDGVGYGEWKSFNLSIPGTPPSIRIGKQPVVSNLTDVAMNFQIADWGCTTVNTIKVYYTRTDIGVDNTTAPTTSSDVWEFTTDININGNDNITIGKLGLPSGNYNIKAVACNASGCGDLSDMASFTIQACEKPAVPKIVNPARNTCQFLIAYCQKEASNNLLVLVNDVEQGTIIPPTDGSEYTGKIAPDGVGVEKIKEDQNETQINITGLDGNTEYTVTCYQYVPATYCYSEPTTYVIEKIAPVVEVEMTDITTKSATANIEVKASAGSANKTLILTLFQGNKQIDRTKNINESIHNNLATYTWTTLGENTTYKLQVEAEDNKGCQTTEVVEFTTGVCYTPEVKTVSGVNATGKVEATITLAASATNCIYQLFIEDTPIDGSAQEGTGSNLQWIVNQAGTYIVKAWFNTEVVEVPNYCFNAPVEMGKYTLDCKQAPTPVISIDKNTICSNDKNGATITVTALDGITYKLYKDGVEQDNAMVNGEFTGIKTAGTYSVVAVGNEAYCNTSSTSQAVTLTVINANASVTITPTTATTTPWVPVAFTVESTNDSPYTLVYKTGDVDVTSKMVITQTDNSYQVKIPRPDGWQKGNASAGSAAYTVEATLQIAGDVNCGSSATLTITLEDTFDNCD